MPRQETYTTNKVTKELKKDSRFFVTSKGTAYGGGNGRADIDTADKDGIYVGMEIKREKIGKVYPNQLRKGAWIVSSGCRYVVAYPDFKIEDLDNHTIPKVMYTHEDMKTPRHTFELVIDESKPYYIYKGGFYYGEQ
ncbi:TPA: hypothetical protein SGW21_002260 [Staphylococcus aureus]|nr:hypothetical protein [Staphylococcus aureus]HDJ5786363.1 hypothetical protein [Staphylococcus aureus]HEH3546686.1 hypothetical protein [Staphylococcus aureus]